MRTSALIRLKGDRSEIEFEWLDFDGDDVFNHFRLSVISETGTRRFDFGGCAVHVLRHVSRFFRDDKKTTVGGGFFRSPDACYLDVHRKQDGYCLAVRFEDSGLCEEFHIQNPRIEIDDEFMRTVYSG